MQTFDLVPGAIRLIGFDYHKKKQILDITSNCGTVYQYFDVPENTIVELENAKNPSDYYKTSIRNKFRRMFKAYDYSVMF
jgi:hypothetical protein